MKITKFRRFSSVVAEGILITIMSLVAVQDAIGAEPRLFEKKAFTAASFAKAVNYFVRLGEDKAVKALTNLASDPKHQYSHGFDMNERIGRMCRVLFKPKGDKPLRPPQFGGLVRLPDMSMPLSRWPLYPVVRSGSTYFVLSERYALAGFPESPKKYIEYSRTNGIFRSKPVGVPTKEQAFRDADALFTSATWKALKWRDSGTNWSYALDEAAVREFIWAQAEDIR